MIPAKGIARLDIVSVLAGRSGDRKVHRGLPAAGVVVMVLSGIALIWSVVSDGGGGPSLRAISSGQLRGLQALFIVGGTIGLVLGCLMVIPALLALVGRLGTRLVLPLRLAARDTARQRGRSTPAVAAIMAAVAALTALSIGAASDARQQEDTYKPQRPMGTGVIQILYGEDSNERSVLACWPGSRRSSRCNGTPTLTTSARPRRRAPSRGSALRHRAAPSPRSWRR